MLKLRKKRFNISSRLKENKFSSILIWLVLGIFMLPTLYAFPLCQELTDAGDIPCLGLTSATPCTGNVSVYNLNTSTQYNLTTAPVGDGTYNFTFPFNISSYSLTACDNSTATIVVGYFAGGFGITQFAFLIPEIILILGSLLFAKVFLGTEEDNQVKPSKYFFAFASIVIGFMIILFMCATVNAYVQQYTSSNNIIKLYNYFYTGLIYIFFAMCGLNIAVFVSYFTKRKRGEQEDLMD